MAERTRSHDFKRLEETIKIVNQLQTTTEIQAAAMMKQGEALDRKTEMINGVRNLISALTLKNDQLAIQVTYASSSSTLNSSWNGIMGEILRVIGQTLDSTKSISQNLVGMTLKGGSIVVRNSSKFIISMKPRKCNKLQFIWRIRPLVGTGGSMVTHNMDMEGIYYSPHCPFQ
ncbi:hypothetical protein Vadar_019423 [Vaccinium darrowii]|uniref:Uncharacterized protein n=1 Tax=Vaccinium darrowii TaxID=229202 RepID=A0ACB7ZLA5_9ERIC|nr:hypothetical protein Vadar_019423 [Vaccinium darrowii]